MQQPGEVDTRDAGAGGIDWYAQDLSQTDAVAGDSLARQGRLRGDHQGRRPVLEYPVAGMQAKGWIDDDANRGGAFDLARRQQRVVGGDGAGADDHRVAQRPQPVGMADVLRAADPAGFSGFRGDPAVERLGDPGQDETAIGGAGRVQHRIVEVGTSGGRICSHCRQVSRPGAANHL